MAAYYIDVDEAWPVFGLVKPSETWAAYHKGGPVEIPDDLLARVRAAERAFWAVQAELRALSGFDSNGA